MRQASRVLPYLAAVALVVLLLRQIDPLEVVRLLANVQPAWLLAGFGAYVGANVLRAYRFGVLLPLGPVRGAEGSLQCELRPATPAAEHPSPALQQHGDPLCPGRQFSSSRRARSPSPSRLFALSPLRILPEMFALSLLNNTLPSRGGELSFPYFMRQRHGMAVGESAAALVVARIFDYLAVALLYVLFALLNLERLAPRASRVVLAVAAALLLALVVLAVVPWLGRQGLRAVTWLLARLRLDGRRVGHLLLAGGERAVVAFQRMRTPRTYALTMGWSLLIWLGTFAWFAAFMQAIGLPQPYAMVIVGGTFAMLAKALPFITVGGFGAHEAGWAVGFGLAGMSTDLAIASGFAVNILTLLASAIFGGLALAYMRLQPPAGRSPDRLPEEGDGIGDA